MKKILNYLLPAVFLLPVVASAQDSFGEVDTFFNDASSFINDTLIPILIAVSFLIFIWGLVQFFLIAKDDNKEAKQKGKDLMLWGVFAFVIIVSVWGIVALISGGLGLNDSTLQNVPGTPGSRF